MGIGDEIMASGRARVMQQTDPRKVKMMHGRKVARCTIWNNNPRIAGADEKGDFQLLFAKDPATNMRPYHLSKDATRWTYNLSFRPDAGEIYLDQMEKGYAAMYPGRLILEPHIKVGASPNKQWGWDRWQKLADLLIASGRRVSQMGMQGVRVLRGAEFVWTPTFRQAAAVLGRAESFVLPEGGLHHAAAAQGVGGVVIFGGFTPVELTGYWMHSNLGASLGDACGNRLACKHCADWMERLTPEMVYYELMARMK